jgi:hypothetical protein
MTKVKVTAWNNGTHDSRGKGYGIRIGKRNRHLFEQDWQSIALSIEGDDFIEVKITSAFWRDCPEVRNEHIGQWLILNKFAPWKKHEPPKFMLTKLGGGEFRLDRLA